MKRAILLTLCFSLANTVFAGEVLTLEKSIETALSDNLQVMAISERVMQAEYAKKEASTYFLPRIGSSFTYTRLNEAQSMEMGGMSFEMTDANLYNLALTLSQPLYTGGRLSAAYAQASENVKKTGFDRDEVMQNLAFDVKKGYFSILKAKTGLQTVNSLKEMAKEHLKTAEAFFNEGLVTKVDVLKTEVFLADAEQQIMQADNAVALAKSGFSFLLNRPLSADFEVEDILERMKEKNDIEYWTALSYENRPELKGMKSLSKIYGHGVELEKSGYKPQIALFSSLLFDRGSQPPVDEWADSWNAGIALELDIWNWGETKYKVERARRQKEEIDAQSALLQKSIELEVKAAFLNMATADKQIGTSKKSREKAEENLRMTDLLYREGMATTTDVLGAQTDLTSARNNYYQALYDYQIAYAQLEKAAGISTIRSIQ